jgi:N6-adenosine-specific RNA methylase IME4
VIPFPQDKKYNIIYADPAWSYSGKLPQRAKEQHYKVMCLDDICKLPVSDISADNSILLMWATFPLLDKALRVIRDWGFEYKTCAFTWIKKNKKSDSFFWGMGMWTRSNAEVCLIGTKGKPKRNSASVHQVVYDPIREHSRKPDCVRDRIVQLCGDLPRIELFARQKTDGWDAWGNEV